MSSRRHVQRERRRTERELDAAKAAFAAGKPHLALRIGRRARDAGSMNPRVLVEFARLAITCGAADEAEPALRRVLAMAPNHVGAHRTLAELLWADGRHRAAAGMMERAVHMSPLDRELAARLQAWRTAVPDAFGEEPAAPEVPPPPPAPARLLPFDAARAALALRDAGAVRLPGLLTAAECDDLRAALAAGAPWLDRDEVAALVPGRVHGRWCRELPPWLRELREHAYTFAAGVANRLRTELPPHRHQPRRPPWPYADVPPTLAAWQQREPEHCGPRPGVRMLALDPAAELPGPGIDGPRIDRRSFPLRLAVDLGPGDGEVGLLALLDDRPGRKVHGKTFATRAGDGLLFAARERFDRVGGLYGLQRVRWRLGPGGVERCVLELSFDDG